MVLPGLPWLTGHCFPLVRSRQIAEEYGDRPQTSSGRIIVGFVAAAVNASLRVVRRLIASVVISIASNSGIAVVRIVRRYALHIEEAYTRRDGCPFGE